MSGYLIKDTTKEEREAIVAESLGNISATCDGCSAGIVEMYQAYSDYFQMMDLIEYGIQCPVCKRHGRTGTPGMPDGIKVVYII